MRFPTTPIVAGLFVAGLALAGCNAAERQAIATKCDANLRERAEADLRAGSADSLDVIGRADGAIDAARAARIERAGVHLRRADAGLFVARLAPRSLGRLAKLDFVRSLELSRTAEVLPQ